MSVLPTVGALMARVASAAKIDDWHVRLRAGEPFVASLPMSREEAEAPPPKPKKPRVKKAKKAPPEA